MAKKGLIYFHYHPWPTEHYRGLDNVMLHTSLNHLYTSQAVFLWISVSLQHVSLETRSTDSETTTEKIGNTEEPDTDVRSTVNDSSGWDTLNLDISILWLAPSVCDAHLSLVKVVFFRV
jgi:hypothetical protein